jgi:hypothetical protein
MNNDKPAPDIPLEEQRNALLARIHASREEYRQQMHAVDAGKPAPSMAQLMEQPQQHPFPRSESMRWLLAHPALVMGGLAVVVLLGPRRLINGLARTGPVISGAASMITMVLHDPAKMRVAGQGISVLRNIIQNRHGGA